MSEPKQTDWYSDLKAKLGNSPKVKYWEIDAQGRRKHWVETLYPEANEGHKKEANMQNENETLTAEEMERKLGEIMTWIENRAKASPKGRFNPNRHLTKIQGRDYLMVKWRIVWFRQDHPDWSIETEPLEVNTERRYVIYRAMVKDETGRLIATGTKVETQDGFPDYLEKAETGAVGRALALCGYGTQFAPELEERDRIVDSPVEREGGAVQES